MRRAVGDDVKAEAARRVNEGGERPVVVAQALGVSEISVRRWAAETKAAAVKAEVEQAEEEIARVVEEEGDPEQERDFALAVLAELDAEISPEMLRILLRAAKRVLS